MDFLLFGSLLDESADFENLVANNSFELKCFDSETGDCFQFFLEKRNELFLGIKLLLS